VDATKPGPPIAKWIFGGFMEPATTGVWAEMLADRKFYAEVSSKPNTVQTGGFGRRGPQRRWVPVGADAFVAMDRKSPYVGEWSPAVRLEAADERGIGNEMYGPWQWGHLSIRQYAEKHNLMVKAMRQVDPTIKVIASGATPEQASWCYIENRQLGTFAERETVGEPLPFAFGSSQDWTGALLKTSAEYTDYLGERFYGYPNLVIDPATLQFVESDEPLALKVRRLSNRVPFKFEAWDEYLRRMPFLKDKDIKFAFDEWSPRNRAVGSGPAPVSAPMLNPLTNALVYHEFFRHSDKVGLAVATGGMGTVAVDTFGDAIGLRMEGQIMKVLHDHFAGALPVAVSGNSPQRPTKGVVGIDNSARPSGSPTYPLDVFAALGADRKTLAISVVNPTDTPQDCDLL
jgi:alpha-N-arabinofuranosidase